MVTLLVRRTGNSLAVPVPRALAQALALHEGDRVVVKIERVPDLLSMAGMLKGKITADEFTRLSNEGEELG